MTVARVFELEEMSKESLVNLASELEDQVETMTEEAEAGQAARPVERYANWYKRLHAAPGSNPDLRVAREQVKIVA